MTQGGRTTQAGRPTQGGRPTTASQPLRPPRRATVQRLGARGEGVATLDEARVFIPYALPGETVSLAADEPGDRACLLGVVTPSPDRIPAICPYFETCGGCAVQALALPAYAEWKRGLLEDALARAGIAAVVSPLVDAHGAGRRRATFHARVGDDGRPRVGFMRARSHDIVAIESCPILDPRLADALPAARDIAAALAPARTSLDIVATASDSGLDIDLRGHGPLAEAERARLVAVAVRHGLARLANHGTIVIEATKPALTIGTARVELPPGAFLQATVAGEAALAERVCTALVGAKRIADLFAGIGTFALRLAARAEVAAFDTEAPALAALDRAARAAPGLRATVAARDLMRRPLTPAELDRYDGVVLDPPRAGAEAQMRAIAASGVTRVVSVACDPQTFARDAAILTEAGFQVDQVDAIDQFRYSAHLEIVAAFRRPAKTKRRRLLG